MTETVSSYHFTIAELNVNIQFKESVRNGMHLLPSFEPFKSEAVADDYLFFKLIVDDALPPIRKPHRELRGGNAFHAGLVGVGGDHLKGYPCRPQYLAPSRRL